MENILKMLEKVGHLSATMEFSDLARLLEEVPPNALLAEVRLSGFKMRACPPGWTCTEFDPGVAQIVWGLHEKDYDSARRCFNRSEVAGAECTTPASLWQVARWEHGQSIVIEIRALAQSYGY